MAKNRKVKKENGKSEHVAGSGHTEKMGEAMAVAEKYFQKGMRFAEYYVMVSFVIITIFPLLNYSWIPAFIKFIYFTGFPLLILLFVASMMKETLIKFLAKNFVLRKLN